MKKELIAFEIDPSTLKDMFNSLSIESQIEVDDFSIAKFVPASEVRWDDSMINFEKYFPSFKEHPNYVNTKEKIRVFESSVSEIFGSHSEGEVNTLIDGLHMSKKDIAFYFSEENSDPLSVYPLFSRWFTACAVFNVHMLKTHCSSCLDGVSFWKTSKDYLDKALVYMISRMRATLHSDSDSDNKIITVLQKLDVFKNFQLLTILESSLEVKSNSLVKKEDLLPSDTLINSIIKDLLNS